MKKQTTIYLIPFVLIAILSTSCYQLKDFKEKGKGEVDFLSSITPAEIMLIKESRAANCNPEQLVKAVRKCESIGGNNASNCVSSCCDKLIFCGIKEEELLENMKRYKDDVWSKNSIYFSEDNYDYSNNSEVLKENTIPRINLNSNNQDRLDEELFDTRYIDISIKVIENYICAIKSCAPTSNGPMNYMRFFLMKYGELSGERKAYSNKTTISIVPVIKDEYGRTLEEKTIGRLNKEDQSLIFSPTGECEDTPIENRHISCPPICDQDIFPDPGNPAISSSILGRIGG